MARLMLSARQVPAGRRPPEQRRTGMQACSTRAVWECLVRGLWTSVVLDEHSERDGPRATTIQEHRCEGKVVPTTWTLEDLYRGIARGWKALVIVVITCLLAAYAAFHVFPEKYAATAIHTVEPISVLSAGSSFSTVNMDTEQIVATSTEVLEQAAATLADGTTAAQLSGALETEVPRGSQVLRFIVTTSDPRVSAAWANAIASAYGTQRSEAARAVVAQTSEELERTIDELRERLSQQKPGSPEAASTELQLEALVAEQARLLATPFYAGSLITPAVEPRDSERPSVLVFAAGGLFLGLLLGSLLALLTSGRAHLHSRQGTTATSTAQE